MPPTGGPAGERPSAFRALGWAFRTYFGNAGVFLVLAAVPIVIDVIYTVLAHSNGTFSVGATFNDTTVGSYDQSASEGASPGEVFFGFLMACATFFLMTIYTRGAQLAHAGQPITRAALFAKVRWGQAFLASAIVAALFTFVSFGMIMALAGVAQAVVENMMYSQEFSVAPIIATLLMVFGSFWFVTTMFFMSIWHVPAAVLSGDKNAFTAIIHSIGLMFRYPLTTFLSVTLVGLIGVPMLLVPGGTAFLAIPLGAIAAAHTYAIVSGRGGPAQVAPTAAMPQHFAGLPPAGQPQEGPQPAGQAVGQVQYGAAMPVAGAPQPAPTHHQGASYGPAQPGQPHAGQSHQPAHPQPAHSPAVPQNQPPYAGNHQPPATPQPGHASQAHQAPQQGQAPQAGPAPQPHQAPQTYLGNPPRPAAQQPPVAGPPATPQPSGAGQAPHAGGAPVGSPANTPVDPAPQPTQQPAQPDTDQQPPKHHG